MALLDGFFNRQQPAAPATPMAGLLAPQKSGLFGISGPTLMALGAGIASGEDLSDGLGKGLALASKTKQRENDRESALAPLRANYAALVQSGVSPQEALLQVTSPGTAKVLGDRKRDSEWQKFLLGKPETSAPTITVNGKTGKQPRGIRNNNPLNIEDGKFAKNIAGYTGSDGRFAQFDTADAGINAADTLLSSYGRRGFNTVSKVIGRWAPSSDGNDVAAYSNFVAGKLGVKSGDQIDMTDPAVRQSLIGAMGEFENGQPLPTAQPAGTGNMIDGLTNQQRTLVAAAGPEKGLPLLLDFHAENAAAAKDNADKAKALNATKSVLQMQFPDMEQEQIDAIALSGSAGTFISQALKGTGEKQNDEHGFPVGSPESKQMIALKAQGVDTQAALGIVSGRYVVSLNPQTGQRALIDKATQDIVPLSQPQPAQPSQSGTNAQPSTQTVDAGRTLFEMAPDATGVLSSGAALLSDTVGQGPGAIGEAATFPDQVKAQTEFKLFTNDLIRSMSVNPRFPVAEMQRLMELVPRGVFTSETTLKQALTALDGELARMEERLSLSSRDPSVPVDVRNQDARSLGDVRAARKRIGIPKKASGSKNSVNVGGKDIPWSIKR